MIIDGESVGRSLNTHWVTYQRIARNLRSDRSWLNNGAMPMPPST
jgi:hypothetical protein